MNETTYKTEASASDVIADNTVTYARHTHQTKFPHCVDGLKAIQRRILWTIKSDTEPKRCIAYAAKVVELYHTSGEGSISAAITRMCQSFSNMVPLVEYHGNVGMYADGGSGAADPRYLDVKAGQFTIDVYFKDVAETSLAYQPAATGKGQEPAYLIPKIPMALLTGNFGMAIAYRAKLQSLALVDVCDIAHKYIELHTKHSSLIPSSVMVNHLHKYQLPDFPTHCRLRNAEVMEECYASGETDIQSILDGQMVLTPKSIVITSLPPGQSIYDTYISLGAHLRGKADFDGKTIKMRKHNLIADNFQSVDDYSSDIAEAKIELVLKRGTSPFDILDELKTFINFTKPWSPQTLVLNKESISEYMTIYEILEVWYSERVRSVRAELKHRQNLYVQKIRELAALIAVNADIDYVFSLFKSSAKTVDTIEPLCNKFGITPLQAQYISSIKFASLTAIGIVTLQSELSAVEKKMLNLRKEFVSIPARIQSEILAVKDRWVKHYPRKCKQSTFIGAVIIDNIGVIQFDNYGELHKIIHRFGYLQCVVSSYNFDYTNVVVNSLDKKLTKQRLTLPKEFVGRYVQGCRTIPTNTFVLEKGYVTRVAKVVVDPDIDCVYTSDNILTVNNRGEVCCINANSLPTRKVISSKGHKSDIVYIHENCSNNVIVTIDTKRSNVFVVHTDLTKPLKGYNHTTKVIGCFKQGEQYVVTLPIECIKRSVNRHVVILANTNGGFKIVNVNSLKPMTPGSLLLKVAY